MALDDPTTLLNLAIAGTSLILILYRLAYKDGKNQLKIDTLWSAFIKSAMSEATDRGLVRRRSNPEVVEERVKPLLETLIVQLRKDSVEIMRKPLVEQFVLIEKKFGAKLEEIGIQHGIPYRALLVFVQVLISTENRKP